MPFVPLLEGRGLEFEFGLSEVEDCCMRIWLSSGEEGERGWAPVSAWVRRMERHVALAKGLRVSIRHEGLEASILIRHPAGPAVISLEKHQDEGLFTHNWLEDV